MRGLVHQPPRPWDRHVVRGWLVQSDLQELAQAKRIRHAPGDASFAVDPLKKTDQHQTEVHAWHERRTAQFFVIKLAAAALTELVEASFVQHLIQPLIERMPRSFGQLTAIPETFLSLPLLARSHRHSRILR